MKTLMLFLALLCAQPSFAQQIWGTATGGGNNGEGVLFKYEAKHNQYTVLFHFGGIKGKKPQGQLLYASDGKLYGTTTEGGEHNLGVLFCFDPINRLYEVKHHFSGVASPSGQLSETPSGVIYGTAMYGTMTTGDGGGIFSFDPSSQTFRHEYDLKGYNGRQCIGGLTWFDGRIYGLARQGGQKDKGTIFSFAPGDDSIQVHHHFGADGIYFPYGALTDGGNGKLYGVAFNGVLFSWEPATNTYREHINVGGASQCTLSKGRGGNTLFGHHHAGPYGRGVIFSYNIAQNTITERYYTSPYTALEGFGFQGALLWASDSKLYGLNSAGGKLLGGAIFEFSPSSNTKLSKWHFNPSTGHSPLFSGLIEANADASATSLQENFCGKETSLSRSISVDEVADASSYQIQFRQQGNVVATVNSQSNLVHLSQVPQLQWGNTYQVRAKAIVGNKRSLYGPECDVIIMPEPTSVPATRLAERHVGQLQSRYSILKANPVLGANRYYYQVFDLAGNLVGSSEGNIALNLANLPAIQWNSLYLVRAKASIGALTGPWGAFDTLNIMKNPDTEPLPVGNVGTQCGRVYSIYQSVSFGATPGATKYEVSIYQGTDNTVPISVLYTDQPRFSLLEANGVRWAFSYNFRVKPFIGDIEGVQSPLGCYFSIIHHPTDGYVYALVPWQRGTTLYWVDTLRAQWNQYGGITQYQFAFFEEGASEPLATSLSPNQRLPLAGLQGVLQPGATYLVKVKASVGPFETAWGAPYPLTIGEAAGSNDVLLYPNPAAESFSISVQEAGLIQGYKDGLLLFSTAFAAGENPQINVSRLPKGIYVVRITTAAGTKAKRLVVE